MTQTIPTWAMLLAAVIGSGGFGALVPWLLDKIDAHNPMRDGVRVLLLCELERQQRELVAGGATADNETKARAQTIYDAYHQLGG
ncbi:hypothetical protein, partial [Bifidobacterium olomucense]